MASGTLVHTHPTQGVFGFSVEGLANYKATHD